MILFGDSIEWLRLLVALVVSLFVTAIVLWIMHRWNRLDEPVARSAHSRPMPTAGGIGLVAGFLLALEWGDWELSVHFWAAVVLLVLIVIDDVIRPLRVHR